MTEEKLYRFPGIKPFEVSEEKLFFGRKEDIIRLYKKTQIDNLLVLFAKSGLGKSSLLLAGFIPYLTAQDPNAAAVYIRLGNAGTAEKQKSDLCDALLRKVETAFPDADVNASILEKVGGDNRAWKLFKAIQKQNIETVYLVIDQAEEIFTYESASARALAALFSDLLSPYHPVEISCKYQELYAEYKISDDEFDFLDKPLKIKIIFAVRSDKLSLLNKLNSELPDILRECLELKPLTRSQATQAIREPARDTTLNLWSSPYEISDSALENILNFLSKNDKKPIESFQLQIICRHIENLVIENGYSLVEWEHLGDVSEILQNYYDVEIQKLPTEEDRNLAQKLIEEGLILEEESRRISLLDAVIRRNFAVSEDLLEKLEQSRLIRSEPHLDGGYLYELSHDTLIEPILRSRKKRLQVNDIHLGESRRLRKKYIFLLVAVLFLGNLVVIYWYFQYKKKDEKLEYFRVEQEKQQDAPAVKEQVQPLKEEIDRLNAELDKYMKRVQQFEQDSLKKRYTLNTSETILKKKIVAMLMQRDEKLREYDNSIKEFQKFKSSMQKIDSLVAAKLKNVELYRDVSYFENLNRAIIQPYKNFAATIFIPEKRIAKVYEDDKHNNIIIISQEIAEIESAIIDNEKALANYKYQANELSLRLNNAIYLVELADEKDFKSLKDNLLDVVKIKTANATKSNFK